MVEIPMISLLSEIGFKPTELLILAMLWQNIKNTRQLLDRLVIKVELLELTIKDEV